MRQVAVIAVIAMLALGSVAGAQEFPVLQRQLDRIDAEPKGEMIGYVAAARIAAKEMTPGKLKKAPGRYVGVPVAFNAKIVEITEQNGATFTRVESGDLVLFVVGRFLTDFEERDRVGVIGYLAGTFEYTSQAGWNISIPAVAARAIVSAKEFARLSGKK